MTPAQVIQQNKLTVMWLDEHCVVSSGRSEFDADGKSLGTVVIPYRHGTGRTLDEAVKDWEGK